MIGDGICDVACELSDCEWDGNDCEEEELCKDDPLAILSFDI